MADRNLRLTGDDLARPAKHLPLKVIRELGRKLHRQLPTSGNWETVAEDLGYGFEDIQQFASLSRQEITPGETMLLDWVQRGNGCTLFVLRSALVTADRQDCVEYLEQEIYDKVICMDLLFCIKDETTNQTEHRSVRTRSDSCLLDSLCDILDQPIRDQYSLLDRNASWVNTMAREFKGRELMLLKKRTEMAMEQDPTIDSSNPALGVSNTDMPLGSNSVQFNRQRPGRRPITSQRNVQTSGISRPGRRSLVGAYINLSTNDLDKDRERQHPNDVFHPNIQPSERQAFNTCVSTNYEPGYHESSHSDEMNVNYPLAIPEKGLTKDKHRTVDENSDRSVDELEDSSYHDPSTAMYGPNLDLDEQPFIPDRQDIGDGDFVNDNLTLPVCSRLPHGDSMTSPVEGADCSQRPVVASHDATRDDKHEHAIDDDPIYHYARETSIERDDSITKQKEVARREYREFSEADFPSRSEQDRASQEPGATGFRKMNHFPKASCTLFSGDRMRPVVDGQETQYGDMRYNQERFDNIYAGDVFIEDPVYNDNDSLIYKDFDTINVDTSDDRPLRSHITDDLYSSDDTLVKTTMDRPMDARTSDYNDSLHADVEGTNYIDSDTFVYGSTTTQASRRRIGEVRHPMDATNEPRERLNSGYIDFNNYPQSEEFHPEHRDAEMLTGNNFVTDRDSQRSANSSMKSYSTRVPTDTGSDTLKRVRFANRCMSQFDRTPSTYESLNRQSSCPNFDYTSNLNARAFLISDFSTIAEAFSPSNDVSPALGHPVDDFDRECRIHEGIDDSPTYKTERQIYGKRNSFPGTHAIVPSDKFKFARHSMPLIRNRSNSRPLPEIPVSDRGSYPRSISRSGSSFEGSRSGSDDTYKIVVGGKTSRTMVDSCLANDNLFMHYNNELRGYAGWSPKENEYTIDKTMADVKQENGFYILWYHRAKKNLIVSVTRTGDLLHFRVRQKVIDKRLYFFVNRSMVVPDVKELLQYHHDNGLPLEKQQPVRMRLPVCVKYDRIPVDV